MTILTNQENETIRNNKNRTPQKRRVRKTKRNSENFVFHFSVSKKRVLRIFLACGIFLLNLGYFSNFASPTNIPFYAISISITTTILALIFSR